MEGSGEMENPVCTEDHEFATQRLNELMQEYMKLKEVQRDVS